MKIEYHCKCGLQNFTKEDWLAHWQHGVARPRTQHCPIRSKCPAWMLEYPKIRAVYFFLFTQVRLCK